MAQRQQVSDKPVKETKTFSKEVYPKVLDYFMIFFLTYYFFYANRGLINEKYLSIAFLTSSIGKGLYYALCAAVIVLFIIQRVTKNKSWDERFSLKNNFLFFLLIVFAFVLCYSAYVNNEFKFSVIIGFIWMTILFYKALPRLIKIKIDYYYIPFIIYALLIFVVSLYFGLIPIFGSQKAILGVLKNSNTFGQVFALGTLSCCALSFNPIKMSTRILIGILTTLFLYLIILSQARTALLAIMIVLLFTIVFHGVLALKSGFHFNRKKLIIVLAVVLFVLILAGETVAHPIIEKFAIKMSGNSFLSSRNHFWSYAIETRSLWGHGSMFFINHFKYAAHSSYFEFLGDNGIIAFTLFIVIVTYSLTVTSLLLYQNISDPKKRSILIKCLLFFVFFAVYGLCESIAFTTSYFSLVFYSLIGTVDLLKGKNNNTKAMEEELLC